MPALKLGLGFMGHDGFVMGIDLGFQIPLGSTDVEFEVRTNGGGAMQRRTAGAMVDTQGDMQDGADAAISLIPFIPQLNLLRFGYLF